MHIGEATVKLKRYEGNPILSPNPANGWEDLAVFNPAAWYDEDKKQVMLLYRAAEAGPEYDWEAGKLSVNTPPIKTEHGWLTIYHGVFAPGRLVQRSAYRPDSIRPAGRRFGVHRYRRRQ
jgi:predicted GH43/DUF377 family glycosyl hydrolase